MDLTEYFCRNSLDRGALINFLLTLLGAEKCALRHFRRDEDTVLCFFIFGSVLYGWLFGFEHRSWQASKYEETQHCILISTEMPQGTFLSS
jgi:hypothetical protein